MITQPIKRGVLVYIDTSFSGKLPVKIENVLKLKSGGGVVVATVTAERGAYKKGDVVRVTCWTKIIPRKAVRSVTIRPFELKYTYCREVWEGYEWCSTHKSYVKKTTHKCNKLLHCTGNYVDYTNWGDGTVYAP